VLRSALGDDEEDRVKPCRVFLHSGKQLQACASFVAIGELVNGVVTARKRVDLVDIARVFEEQVRAGNLVTFGLGGSSTEVFACAKELRRQERELTPCDAMVVACAIEDPACSVLYTFDRLLLESEAVQDYASRHNRKIKSVE